MTTLRSDQHITVVATLYTSTTCSSFFHSAYVRYFFVCVTVQVSANEVINGANEARGNVSLLPVGPRLVFVLSPNSLSCRAFSGVMDDDEHLSLHYFQLSFPMLSSYSSVPGRL